MSADRAFARDRHTAAGRSKQAPGRPALRSVPGGVTRMPRAPFVVLVLLVLGIGLIGLLVLNTAIQQGSFALDELEAETAELRDRQTTLADDVADRSAPESLAEAARQLGMVPAEEPVFVELPPPDSAGEDR